MSKKDKKQKRKKESLNVDFKWNPRQNPFSVCFVQPGSIPFIFERSFLNSLKKKSPLLFQQYLCQALSSGVEVQTFVGVQFLTDLFEQLGAHAQIIGDHGTGKSTLLHFLTDSLSKRGFQVFSFSLHDSQRSLPQEFWIQMKKSFESFPSNSSDLFRLPEMVQLSESLIQYHSADNETDHSASKEINEIKETTSIKKIVILDGFEQLSYVSRYQFRSFCRKNQLGFLLSTHSSAVAVPVLFRTHPSYDAVRKIVDYLLDDSEFFLFESEIRALMKKSGNDIRKILFDLYDEYENHLDSLGF